jgi:nucleoside-diphosphate-sugar epimerase
LTHYGRSKLAAEKLVRELAPDAVVVRPPVVYGPGDRDVFQLLKSISRGVVLEIAGGERWFNAIYVKDLCEGLLAAARHPRAAGRAYFLAHARAISWSEFGAAAAKILGRTPRVLRVPAPVAYAVGACAEMWARVTGKPGIVSREKIREALCPAWTCDTRRASEELEFTAGTSIEAGLAEALVWYREAGWLA